MKISNCIKSLVLLLGVLLLAGCGSEEEKAAPGDDWGDFKRSKASRMLAEARSEADSENFKEAKELAEASQQYGGESALHEETITYITDKKEAYEQRLAEQRRRQASRRVASSSSSRNSDSSSSSNSSSANILNQANLTFSILNGFLGSYKFSSFSFTNLNWYNDDSMPGMTHSGSFSGDSCMCSVSDIGFNKNGIAGTYRFSYTISNGKKRVSNSGRIRIN